MCTADSVSKKEQHKYASIKIVFWAGTEDAAKRLLEVDHSRMQVIWDICFTCSINLEMQRYYGTLKCIGMLELEQMIIFLMKTNLN